MHSTSTFLRTRSLFILVIAALLGLGTGAIAHGYAYAHDPFRSMQSAWNLYDFGTHSHYEGGGTIWRYNFDSDDWAWANTGLTHLKIQDIGFWNGDAEHGDWVVGKVRIVRIGGTPPNPVTYWPIGCVQIDGANSVYTFSPNWEYNALNSSSDGAYIEIYTGAMGCGEGYSRRHTNVIVN